MRFLCLVYFEPETLMALSPAEKATLNRDSLAYNRRAFRKGMPDRKPPVKMVKKFTRLVAVSLDACAL